jgi:hypothetical protein
MPSSSIFPRKREGTQMPATLDLIAVHRFTEDLNDRLRRCDNSEGMMCATLDENINHYVQACAELREYVNHWARAIFTGQTAFDPAVEDHLRTEVRRLLHRAKQLAARGRAMDGECFVLHGLNSLHRHMADFDYLLENWVRPRMAVSPTPRVKLSQTTEQQVNERVSKLEPLPANWRPADPEQLVFFQTQQAK